MTRSERRRLPLPLLSTLPEVDEVVDHELPLPVCDFQLPLMSVPAVLNLTLDEIPNQTPYLFGRDDLRTRWRERMSKIEGQKIGIVWQGSPTYSADHRRSMPLAHFEPLARLPGIELFSLQKGFGREQIATVGFPVADLGKSLDESTSAFEETAAVIQELDLEISSDTAIVHLAGAVGVTNWVALSKAPDWRFLLDREDSPWYPKMRLFRQTEFGDWSGVLDSISQAMHDLTNKPKN